MEEYNESDNWEGLDETISQQLAFELASGSIS